MLLIHCNVGSYLPDYEQVMLSVKSVCVCKHKCGRCIAFSLCVSQCARCTYDIFNARNSSCRKVMFSQECVRPQGERRVFGQEGTVQGQGVGLGYRKQGIGNRVGGRGRPILYPSGHGIYTLPLPMVLTSSGSHKSTYDYQVGNTHPTGMLSCSVYV